MYKYTYLLILLTLSVFSTIMVGIFNCAHFIALCFTVYDENYEHFEHSTLLFYSAWHPRIGTVVNKIFKYLFKYAVFAFCFYIFLIFKM